MTCGAMECLLPELHVFMWSMVNRERLSLLKTFCKPHLAAYPAIKRINAYLWSTGSVKHPITYLQSRLSDLSVFEGQAI